MSPATLSDTTVIDLWPPLTVNRPAASAKIMARYRVTVEIVRTCDFGNELWLVETRNDRGALTSTQSFTDDKAAMLCAYRMEI